MQPHSLPLRGGMVLFAMTFILCSCHKEIKDLSTVALSGSTTGKDGFPNYPFNWETATTMMPSTTEPQYNPTLPWLSQSGSYIDPGIISDYKSADGWVLVYNTFNPTNNEYLTNAADGGLYFALYNKFRGILRFYLYIPAGQFGGGANIQHGLSVYTSGSTVSTSLLNFDGADVVDPNTNVAAFTKTNNVGVAEQGGWYAMQYEIAYDPKFNSSNDSYPNIGISWNSRTVSISNIQLDGTQTGTITGNITQQSNGVGTTIIDGVLAAAEIFSIAEGIPSSDTFLFGLNSAAENGLAGSLTGFLSGIFGGNSNNPQTVDLTMNSTISLTGTINTPNALAPNTLVFPGESIASNNLSSPPLYTSPLGVFNLTTRPTVTQIVHTTPDDQGLYDVQYEVSGSQFNSILATNPAVWDATGGANYENFTTLVQIINPVLEYNLLEIGSSTTIMNSTNAPYVGNRIVIQQNVDDDGDPIPLVTYYGRNPAALAQTSSSLGTAAVQVSFNVYPNNGGAACTIVKTFLANLQTIIE